jgi:uridine kinase
MLNPLEDPQRFSDVLLEKMRPVNAGVQLMEPYEFRYCLNNLYPAPGGWASIQTADPASIEQIIHDPAFYNSIRLKPSDGERILLDEPIVRLTRMLLVGLVTGAYSAAWVREHFYFDIRGFYFLTRTHYFPERVRAHLGGQPYRSFEPKQKLLETRQDVGYQEFQAANAEVDAAFEAAVRRVIAARGTPIILAIAGPTAAGKTEIVARLRECFESNGQKVTTIEMDNYLTDRDEREARGIHSFGKAAIHLNIFLQNLADITGGKTIYTPRYDFIYATSSHDASGQLKPGGVPIEVPSADIIFLEGNFPFLLEEVAPLIGIKVVYLTDDDVRLKRKWKRDIDYRKKYEPTYLRNRYFRDQFLMARQCLLPQMEVCDMVVDTTGAALWTTAEIAALLDGKE